MIAHKFDLYIQKEYFVNILYAHYKYIHIL
jgi:hypothetical protein